MKRKSTDSNGNQPNKKLQMYNQQSDQSIIIKKVFAAASNNNVAELKKLLTNNKIYVDNTYEDDYTLLQFAINAGYEPIVKLLLEYGANPNSKEKRGEIGGMEGFSNDPLYLAAKTGRLDIVKLLLEHKVKVDIDVEYVYHPLHVAATEGYLDIVKILLEYGVDADTYNGDGISPLYMAAIGGYLDIVKLLLQHIKEIEPVDGKKNPLFGVYEILKNQGKSDHIDKFVEIAIFLLGKAPFIAPYEGAKLISLENQPLITRQVKLILILQKLFDKDDDYLKQFLDYPEELLKSLREHLVDKSNPNDQLNEPLLLTSSTLLEKIFAEKLTTEARKTQSPIKIIASALNALYIKFINLEQDLCSASNQTEIKNQLNLILKQAAAKINASYFPNDNCEIDSLDGTNAPSLKLITIMNLFDQIFEEQNHLSKIKMLRAIESTLDDNLKLLATLIQPEIKKDFALLVELNKLSEVADKIAMMVAVKRTTDQDQYSFFLECAKSLCLANEDDFSEVESFCKLTIMTELTSPYLYFVQKEESSLMGQD